jgi:hypothetical protein
MKGKKITAVLVVTTFIALGVLTVIPNPAAHHISHLGYNAVCAFAPFSTVTLLILAVASYVGFKRTLHNK